jgi:hypothetical protein
MGFSPEPSCEPELEREKKEKDQDSFSRSAESAASPAEAGLPPLRGQISDWEKGWILKLDDQAF